MGQNQNTSVPDDLLRHIQEDNFNDAHLGRTSGEEIYGMASKERTHPNVLSRLKYILDKKGETPMPYKDAEFKQFWLPDSESKACYDCSDKFHAFRRRHHCRICGQIFCRNCCNKMVPGKILGYTGELRVCMFCCKVTFSFLKSTNVEKDILADLKAVQQQLLPNEDNYDPCEITTGCHTNNATNTDGKVNVNCKRKSMYGFMEENYAVQSRALNDKEVQQISSERQLLLKDSEQLRSLWSQMIGNSSLQALPLSTNRWKLKVFPNSFIGSEFVQWLIEKDKASSRQSAVAIGQALLEAGYIFCMCQNNQIFVDDYLIYNIIKSGDLKSLHSSSASNSQDGGHEPLWLKQIKSQADGEKYEERSFGSPHKYAKVNFNVSDVDTDYNMSNSSYSLNMNLEDNVVSMKSWKKERGHGCQSSVTDVLNSSVLSEQVSSSTLMADEVLQAIKTLEAKEAEKRAAGWQQPNPLSEPRECEKNLDEQTKLSLTVQERFNTLWSTHEKKLLDQLLQTSGLSSNWADTIMPIVYKVVETVRPDVKNECDDMDIRQYIQFKKVPGGKRKDCLIVNGTVCTKNIVHRNMKSSFLDPQILLISSDIDHTAKNESEILSVSNVVTQEIDYLKRIIPKIISFRPDIILCGKRITFNAREQLKGAGITLVVNLKQSVMERVARCTQASIINSVETDLTSVPLKINSVSRPLGMCHSFYLRHFNLPTTPVCKTLMFFDGCATHLGCTIILRGASNAELKRVKRIMYFMIFALHNWKLERSFLMDEFAFYPSYTGDSFQSVHNSDNNEENNEIIGKKDNNKDRENVEYRRKLGEMDEKLGTKDASLIASTLEERAELVKDNSNGEKIPHIENESIQSETILKSDGRIITMEEIPVNKSDLEYIKRPIFPTNLESNTIISNGRLTSDIDLISNNASKSSYPSHSTPEKNSQAIAVEDCSDPLQSYLKKGLLNFANIFDNKKENSSILTLDLSNNDRHCFKACIDKTILTISPHLKYNVPFLETEAGQNSALRKFLLEKLYFSPLLDGKKTFTKIVSNNTVNVVENQNIRIKPLHTLITMKLSKSAKSLSIREQLADFRARGCTIENICRCEQSEENLNVIITKEISQDEEVPAGKKEKCYNSAVNTAEGQIDALHPFNHQRISVLFSNFSVSYHQSSTFCVDPWVLTMYFYGRNDIPLGAYLERYCFNLNYQCPFIECNVPCLRHVRKFVHEAGCIEILLRKMDSTLDESNSSTIYLWSWCKICRQVSPVVPMSSDTWKFSFAKYLELRFQEKAISRRGNPGCPHSIHRDHFHYFGQHNVVAVFRYSSIDIRELIIPPSEIPYLLYPAHKSFIVDQIKSLAVQGYGLFSTILDKLTNVSEEIGQRWEPILGYVAAHHQQQRKVFREGIESIQMQLTSPSLERRSVGTSSPTSCQELATIMYGILDQVIIMKRLLVTVVNDWNVKVQTLYQVKKKEERIEKSKVNTTSTDQASTLGGVPSSSAAANYLSDPTALENSAILANLSHLATTEKTDTGSSFEAVISQTAEEKRTKMVRSSSNPEPSMDMTMSAQNTEGICRDDIPRTEDKINCYQSLVTESKTLLEEKMRLIGIVDGLFSVTEPPIFSPSDRSPQVTPEPMGTCVRPGLHAFISPVKSYQHHERSLSDDLEASFAKELVEKASEKRYSSSVKNIISTLLSSSADLMVKSPFDPNEHYGTLPEVKIPLVLYDDELSSIIAVSLASQEYDAQLQALQLKLNEFQQYNENGKLNDNQSISSSNSPEVSTSPENSTNQGTPTSSQKTDEIPQKNHHIELQWNDSHANYYCKIYFAERFRRLRSIVFPYGEELFIRSLSRCVIWEARGGKSGSSFCKTVDDRFILKEMSKLEVNSFFDFAPDYFQYITDCHKNKQPTTLARTVGVFRIGFKNTTTGKQQKCDLLVMENLFYQRTIGPKYDLKGSVRNRKVDVTGKMESELVLMDENLLQMACSSQFFLRPHNKAILMKAINADSAFLSQHFIMDYSLLVGLDENKDEIVVGIIDYIRTFTWDKKLETILKGSVLSAGAGKQPTIISPELYRNRFCVAMEKYFAVSPDRWSGLSNILDS